MIKKDSASIRMHGAPRKAREQRHDNEEKWNHCALMVMTIGPVHREGIRAGKGEKEENAEGTVGKTGLHELETHTSLWTHTNAKR